MAGCSCGGSQIKLLYSCSGAANTGLLTDQVTRKLRDQGFGSMTCLAAVGADLSGFVQSAKSADKNIVIDGCPVGCGKKIFENKDIPFLHFILTDYGVEKGKTLITSEVIERVTNELSVKI